MANLAPGYRSSTAWAITWAAECRSTCRPSSVVSVITANAPSDEIGARDPSRRRQFGGDRGLGKAGADTGGNSSPVTPSGYSRMEPSGKVSGHDVFLARSRLKEYLGITPPPTDR